MIIVVFTKVLIRISILLTILTIIRLYKRVAYELLEERNYTWLWKSVVYLWLIIQISAIIINPLFLSMQKIRIKGDSYEKRTA